VDQVNVGFLGHINEGCGAFHGFTAKRSISKIQSYGVTHKGVQADIDVDMSV
jgi:hypothetical protein